ncbi:MAG TPA: 5-formyltetrahydrofolate cyclo-ligase [Symbiobacteriaceae bacterium]|nr:5-formyltetrahydrofolate cyclo-ligase [Symbiobacteriaceae bacterium]
MEKTELRKFMMERRLAQAPAERERLSLAAQAALIGSPAFAAARLVLLYIAFRGEVATEAIAAAAVAAGKGLALPRVIREPRGLVLHAYNGDPATLARGAYGIAEPRPDWPVVAPAAVDLVVVPGVAFDRTGGRLGYGGGYYDRLLPEIRAAHPGAMLVGLAYDCQVTDGLPRDPHDIPVDGLATELGYVSFGRDG